MNGILSFLEQKWLTHSFKLAGIANKASVADHARALHQFNSIFRVLERHPEYILRQNCADDSCATECVQEFPSDLTLQDWTNICEDFILHVKKHEPEIYEGMCKISQNNIKSGLIASNDPAPEISFKAELKDTHDIWYYMAFAMLPSWEKTTARYEQMGIDIGFDYFLNTDDLDIANKPKGQSQAVLFGISFESMSGRPLLSLINMHNAGQTPPEPLPEFQSA